MLTAWFFIGVILALVWLVVVVLALASGDVDSNFREFSATMSVIFVAILFWPIVLASIIPAFVIYGLVQAVKLTLESRRAKA